MQNSLVKIEETSFQKIPAKPPFYMMLAELSGNSVDEIACIQRNMSETEGEPVTRPADMMGANNDPIMSLAILSAKIYELEFQFDMLLEYLEAQNATKDDGK